MKKLETTRWTTWTRLVAALALATLGVAACDDDGGGDGGPEPVDPATAPRVEVDRFSAETGTLFVRAEGSSLPGPDEPIDFDQPPFVTQGLGPGGEVVRYYNFDVMPAETAPIFALFREGESSPVTGQLNVIDVLPGDEHYSDFWHVHKVTVPADYAANTVTSVAEIMDAGYPIERTEMIVNCPVVPDGSTATMRHGGGETGLVEGWYRGQVVSYFDFSEHPVTADLPPEGHPPMPTSPIYVTFAVNPDPDNPMSGPASGFMMEMGTMQTHNVIATLPGDDGYSPLWVVHVLDNADFGSVMDLTSAQAATELNPAAATVNCPVVSVQ